MYTLRQHTKSLKLEEPEKGMKDVSKKAKDKIGKLVPDTYVTVGSRL
jgi:hypothetical protein